jgi:hypothetical protein
MGGKDIAILVTSRLIQWQVVQKFVTDAALALVKVCDGCFRFTLDLP